MAYHSIYSYTINEKQADIVTRTEADKACRKRAGKLAMIDDKDSNTRVAAKIKSDHGHYWIGPMSTAATPK